MPMLSAAARCVPLVSLKMLRSRPGTMCTGMLCTIILVFWLGVSATVLPCGAGVANVDVVVSGCDCVSSLLFPHPHAPMMIRVRNIAVRFRILS